MEGVEIEMSREELQKWIREKVQRSKLISTDVREKFKLLQSLLERREKQAAHLLKLCQSVAACEAIVKKQYSLLGWEYTDTDSDDDVTVCGNPPPTPRELKRDNGIKNVINRKRKPVVALTRLSKGTIRSLCSSARQNHYGEDGSPVNLRDSHCKPRPPKTSRNYNIVSDPGPVIISSAFALCADEITKVRPNLPEVEIKVDMTVLARKRAMRWQRGKIVEIMTRDNGRLKYKVCFEENGKSLVSDHHIAFDTTPKLEQLYVGARVVVRSQDNKFRFRPGVVAELPCRKNHVRFLVFMDDHKPIYVGLPQFHLVCRPLENVLDDIPDSRHKSFMSRYLKDWPYPHLTQYKPGQSLNVEENGVQKRCEVHLVDGSLIQVIYQDNQNKEWIHRGSVRLEHMERFLELQSAREQREDSVHMNG